MASLFDALAGQSNANPDDPTGAYLGNLIDPRTAAQFQAARNQSGDLGFWQGVLQASAPHLGVSGTSPAAAGILGQMQAQNLLPQQALQSAQTGNTAADNMYKRLQAVQLGNQIQNDPAFFNMMKMIAQRYAQQQGGGGSEQGSPMVQPGAASQTGTTSPTGMSTQAGMSSPGSTQNSDTNSGSPTYADKVIHWEAGGDPNAVNPKSSATGLGQFLDGTWLNLFNKTNPNSGMSDSQILALRTNPDISRAMINAYGQENAGILAKAGVPINDATLYGAHWFGPAGAAKIFSASQDTPLASLGFSPKVLALNNLTGGTAGDFANIVSRKMGAGVLTLPGLANAQTAQAQGAQGSGSSQAPSGAMNAAPATPGIPAGIGAANAAPGAPAGIATPSAPIRLAQAGGNPYAGLPLSPAEALQLEILAGAAGRTNMIPDAFKGIAQLPTERAKAAQGKDVELQYTAPIAQAGFPYSRQGAPRLEPFINPVTAQTEYRWVAPPTPGASPQMPANAPQGAVSSPATPGPQTASMPPQGPQGAPSVPLPQVPNYSGAMGGPPQVPMVPSMPSPSMGPVPQPGQNLINMIGGRPTLAPPGTRMPPPGGVPIGTPGAGPVISPAQAAQMNANAGHASLPVMPTSYVFGPGMAPPPGAGSVSQPAPMVPMVPSRPPLAAPQAAPQPVAPAMPPAQMVQGQAQGLMPGSVGIAKLSPTQETELKGRGEELSKFYTDTNLAAEAARNQQTNLLVMRNDAQNIYTGPGAENLLGFQKIMRLVDPAYDQPVASGESFVKNGGTLVRSAVKQESSKAAAQEFTMIANQLPGLTTSPKGLQETLGEFMGFNDYNIAKANAMAQWVHDPANNNSVAGFEAAWRKNVDPYTFLVRRMEPDLRQQLFAKLNGSDAGKAALAKLVQQDQYIEQNGLGPSF